MKRQGLACRWISSIVAVVAFAAASRCGGNGTPPPSSPGAGDSGERINGNERLGWNQPAANATELATFRFAVYVDGGNRVELTDASCTPSGAPFPCNSAMPPMSPGAHTLEVVSYVFDGSTTIESARSPILRVTVAGVTAGGPEAGSRIPPELVTADGLHLRVELLTDRIETPTALAFAADGRLFVAERSGAIRILSSGVLTSPSLVVPDPAIQLDDVLMAGPSQGGLLDVALDPEFDRTGFVYAVYTTGAGGTPRFRLVRLRESGGRLGERSILLDNLTASPTRPAASIEIGPDNRIYAAFDDGDDPARAGALASYNGKVLRLNLDGTTPSDQPAGSPVYASDLQSPRALAWDRSTGSLWVSDAGPAETLRVIAREATRFMRGGPRVSIPLPARTGAASLAFYQRDQLPAFRGDLLIAADEGGYLGRLRFDTRNPGRIVSAERLMQDSGERFRVVTVGVDGAVYVATERALLRLGPQ